MVPMLFLGVFGGVFADRINRKRLLVFTQSANFVATLVMTLFLFAEVAMGREIVAYWHAYVILLTSGVGWALDMPSRRSVVLDLLGRDRVTNGIAVDSIGMQSSMMTGPILAGVLVSLISFSGTYVIITAFYLVSVVLMWLVRMPPQVNINKGPHNIFRNLFEGFRYVSRQNTILAVVVITVFMNLLLFPYQQMVTVIGRDVLGAAPWLIGMLMGAQGFGSLTGGILIASSSGISHHGRVYFIGSMFALLMLLLFSFSRWVGISLPLLYLLGLGAACFGTMQSTIVMLVAREEMRGRALGVITLAIGAGPLGSLMVGALASATSPTLAITMIASAGLVTVGLAGLFMSSIRQRIVADEPIQEVREVTPVVVEAETEPKAKVAVGGD
jgi:MFS family permease